MERLVIMFLMALCASPITGQDLTGTIRGKVLDIQSNSTIPGANIIVLGTDPILGAVSGPDGDFIINNVPVGRHTLKISFIGYADRFLPEILVTTGKNLYFDIKLEESLVQMDEIVVIAKTDKGEPLNEMATVSAKSFSVEETSRPHTLPRKVRPRRSTVTLPRSVKLYLLSRPPYPPTSLPLSLPTLSRKLM